MSREAIRELQERRQGHLDAITTIDAALKLLGGTGRRTRARTATNTTRSEAAKAMWAKRRAGKEGKSRGSRGASTTAATVAKPRVRSATQRQRNNAHPVQAVSRPASLAAAAEGN